VLTVDGAGARASDGARLHREENTFLLLHHPPGRHGGHDEYEEHHGKESKGLVETATMETIEEVSEWIWFGRREEKRARRRSKAVRGCFSLASQTLGWGCVVETGSAMDSAASARGGWRATRSPCGRGGRMDTTRHGRLRGDVAVRAWGCWWFFFLTRELSWAFLHRIRPYMRVRCTE
jgi:hypothetical protein